MSHLPITSQARADAVRLLQLHGQGTRPVDPVRLARAIGVRVFDTDLAAGEVSRTIAGHGGADLYINRTLAPDQYRRACAHALGHSVDPYMLLAPGTGYIDHTQNPVTDEETYADAFAEALLSI